MRRRVKCETNTERQNLHNFDYRLAAYLAAGSSLTTLLASNASAIVVSNSTVQPFGINQEVNIDFNKDGQIDYQIDHDRVNLNGVNLDYLQLDKNDISSAANPYPIDNFSVFPTNGTPANSDHGYLTNAGPGESGYYPAALPAGTVLGPNSTGVWDFQEGENFLGSHQIIRANRLIDEDATQIDAANPNPPAGTIGVFPPLGTPGWVGLAGQTRYLGVRLDLNDAGHTGFNNDNSQYWYGWIGIRITNETDATGEVTGWGYQSELGMPIMAGETAPGVPGDYNGNGVVDAADYVLWRNGGPLANEVDAPGTVNAADFAAWRVRFGNTSGSGTSMPSGFGTQVPEPGSLMLSICSSIALIGIYLIRRIRGK